ncbi:MAG TPA: hypothetical protein VGE74_27945 [Gemmata sp.]
MIHFGDDERYDRRLRFAGRSALRLKEVRARLRRYAGEYGLAEFEYTAEPDGHDLEAWGKARGDAIGLTVPVAADWLPTAKRGEPKVFARGAREQRATSFRVPKRDL